MKFRKKPVVIEATCNHGTWPPILAWLEETAGNRFGGFAFQPGTEPPITRNHDGSLNIRTPNGIVRAEIGEWVIQDVKGEFYPCKPDVFAATYEPVD